MLEMRNTATSTADYVGMWLWWTRWLNYRVGTAGL